MRTNPFRSRCGWKSLHKTTFQNTVKMLVYIKLFLCGKHYCFCCGPAWIKRLQPVSLCRINLRKGNGQRKKGKDDYYRRIQRHGRYREQRNLVQRPFGDTTPPSNNHADINGARLYKIDIEWRREHGSQRGRESQLFSPVFL